MGLSTSHGVDQAVAVQLYDESMDCRSTPAVRVPIQKMPRIFELEKSAVFTLRYAQLEEIKVNALCMVNSKTLHHGFLSPELKLYTGKKCVESRYDFQMIFHLHSVTECLHYVTVCKHFVTECK